ncbi:Aste57867_8182 [Aphanomyces stellatus]|uniref:Protein yippee-like n=1 Tax=Aphanomyces stellatus TaxID=120398 RepID=A0A485KJL6_9STRA|nr:hypothetical protein As57867_008151 [Aphanomyces stellatus]VFT85070.1 Aste57867_8182 [Aphanomyces stellatus]
MNMMHISHARRTVTLRFVANVHRSAVPIYAKDGNDDAGNTYHDILCRQCKRILGKWYSATLPAFDAYRMAYTLNQDDLVEFAVGMDAPMDEWNMEGAVAAAAWKANMEHMNDLTTRMEKAQKVLVVVEERLVETKRLVEANQQKQNITGRLPVITWLWD